MRAAICISGQLREFEQTFPSLSQFIIEPFQCDVFLSTWNDLGLPSVPPADPHAVLDRARQLYKPAKMDVESWSSVRQQWGDISFFEQHKRSDANVEGVLAMWYKIWRANQLKVQAEQEGGFKYDVVIRSRSDVYYFESPEFDRIHPDFVYIGDHFGFGGLPDLFAFGPSALMNVYSSLSHHISTYARAGCPVHPELLLLWHIRKSFPQGILFSRTPFRIHREPDWSPCTFAQEG